MTIDVMDITGKCGELNGRYYDRNGDYFRDGIDPRNYFGRLVNKSNSKWKETENVKRGHTV